MDKFYLFHAQKIDYAGLKTIIRQFQPIVKERFLIKIGEHYKSVATTAICAFYILERNVFIFTDTGKNYPLDYSLDKIEQMIDSHLFFRVNRNFIVYFYAIQDVIAYSSKRLKIILYNWEGREEILVSRERVTAFKRWMDR